jgi:penicillin-binding protein-related factor A (putative recombinase)
MSQPKGVADIIGIYRGKPMAIEVKKPGGRLSDDQAKFLKRWAEEGGIAIVAYSVDAVIGQLGLELPMFRKDKRRG